MVPSRGQTILTKAFWVVSNPLDRRIFSKSREYLNLRIQFRSPCFLMEHGGVLIFNVGETLGSPSSFILLFSNFRISQVILAFRDNPSFLGCAAFGSSMLPFWELGICSFLKTTVAVSGWSGAGHTYLGSAVCAFDSFVHNMSCTESRPAHQSPGGPIYFRICLQGNFSSPCAQHCTRLWAIQGNDARTPRSSGSGGIYEWSIPSLDDAAIPSRNNPELGCLHAQPTFCGLTCLILPLHSLFSLQQMIKIIARERQLIVRR